MPTYSYACTECGHAFEQFQSFTDDALTECPECAGRLRKLYNAVGVVFKGSGFYRNDSRAPDTAGKESSDSSSKEGKEKKKDSAGGDSGSSSKGDSSSKASPSTTSSSSSSSSGSSSSSSGSS